MRSRTSLAVLPRLEVLASHQKHKRKEIKNKKNGGESVRQSRERTRTERKEKNRNRESEIKNP
ncbi:hypothetical protein Syun_008857 [Stephania yunnanensis]|uniref:Uncharacterized protein n=1 Tax=Stephania yunnanensis TaxID=152371 RepID=A0AAP0PMY9_9MAGN